VDNYFLKAIKAKQRHSEWEDGAEESGGRDEEVEGGKIIRPSCNNMAGFVLLIIIFTK